jgi:energy-coupling factor transporter transmembrane protein EcfT
MLPFDSNETVLFKVRKHWFVMVPATVLVTLAALAPFVVYGFVLSVFPVLEEVVNAHIALFFFATFVWILLWWMFWFLRWTDYFLDVWYITNKRIVDVEQKGVFHRVVATMRFEKIQDVTYESKGAIAALLDFGDIHVQTAGAHKEIVIRHAKHPEQVKKDIIAQLDKVVEAQKREGE